MRSPSSRATASGVVAHSVRSTEPEVAGNRNRVRGWLGNDVFAVLHGIAQQQLIQFVRIEPDNIEIEVFFLKGRQLDAKHLFVPTRARDRQLVVGDRQRPALNFRLLWC